MTQYVQAEERPGLWRRVFKWVLYSLLAIIALALVLFVIFFRGALYNHFSRFPREKAAWETIRANRMPVSILTGWNEYRGAIHNHSYHSHDSEVPFEHILKTMKEVGRDFIIMSDHCQEGDNNLFGLQWKGLHDGVLFVQGFEMQDGCMPVALPEGTVLSCKDEPPVLAQKAHDAGGKLFMIHCEKLRPWDMPQIDAMEIYNVHPDFMEELKGARLKRLATNLLLNLGSYPDQTFHEVFDPPTQVLKTWDDQNIKRKMGGFAGNDTHQNVGVYGIYKDDGSLLIRHAEGKDIKLYKLNFLTKGVLRLFCGPLTPGKEMFRFQVDPYERMSRHVCTHVLAKELTEPAILEAIIAGRAFIGFDMIADSTGFAWMAKSGNTRVVMGESIPYSPDITLTAASPSSVRFTVFRHGVKIHEEEGLLMRWKPAEPGKYRVQADLNILGEWVPWVYTNPIEITAAAGAAGV